MSSVIAPRYVVAILLGVPLTWYAFKIWRAFYEMKKRSDILQQLFPGPKKHWLWGNLHEHPGMGEEGLEMYRNLTSKHIKAFTMWVHGAGAYINIVHPDTAKAILKTTEPKPMHDGGTYHTLQPWIGEGLLTSNGPKWHRNRRLLTPAFHFDVLLPYMKIYNEATDLFLSNLQLASSENGSVEVFSPVSLLTLNVILRCAFSYDEDVQASRSSHPYVQTVRSIGGKLETRSMNPILIYDFFYFKTKQGKEFLRECDITHELSEKLIQTRKQTLNENPDAIKEKKYHDFLDILLLAKDEKGEGLTDGEIRDEVDTFLFEGHDTTASAISWILYTLAAHPKEQAVAQEEVDTMMQGRDTNELEWDDLSHLPYTTLCIKEAIRLHSPVPIINRSCVNPVEVEGRMVPPFTHFDILIYCIHHNEHVWGKDHMEFKPERFEHENISKMDSHAFVPFSAGPRNCIGQNFAMHEIKVVTARVLHHFTLEVDPERPPKHEMSLVMRAKDGLYVKFTPRD